MPDRGLISVIIPAFNVQSTISDCINSITSQDYSNIEILVINDGSVDDTEVIVSDLVERDGRIRLITTENGGVSQARNRGIAIARGEWIVFVDADDLLLPGALSTLSDYAKRTNSDMVCSSYILVNSSTGKEKQIHLHDRSGLSRGEGHRFFLTEGLNLSQPWAKIYRRNLFDSVFYPEGRMYEDIAVMPMIIENVSSISIIDRPVYKYIQTPQSISQTDDIKKQLEGLQSRIENYRYYKDKYPEFSALSAQAIMYFGYYLLGRIARSGIKENRKYYDKTVKIIRKYGKKCYHNGIFNKSAWVIFNISPRIFAYTCRLISYIKNGL